MAAYYGGIEAGGTKWVCAIYDPRGGSGPAGICAETRFPTTPPEQTLAKAVAFFRQGEKRFGKLAAIGVACFGPLDPNPRSPTFGYITTTPKPGWAHTDVAGLLRRALDVPVGFDTDVNGAALGEARWGAAQGLENFVYFTIGTGIGGGGMINGALLHGLVHPEMGHLRIPHDRQVDPYPGFCAYHGDCLEGLACGPAIQARWGQRAETLPPDHPAWRLETEYLSLAAVDVIVTLSPERIILGGGVMEQRQLFPLIHARVRELLNGYVQAPAILSETENYIVPPMLGNHAGVMGAIALAQAAV